MTNKGSIILLTTNYWFSFLEDALNLVGNSSYIIDGVKTEVVLENIVVNPFQIYLSKAGGQDFAVDACVEVIFADNLVKNYTKEG